MNSSPRFHTKKPRFSCVVVGRTAGQSGKRTAQPCSSAPTEDSRQTEITCSGCHSKALSLLKSSSCRNGRNFAASLSPASWIRSSFPASSSRRVWLQQWKNSTWRGRHMETAEARSCVQQSRCRVGWCLSFSVPTLLKWFYAQRDFGIMSTKKIGTSNWP